MNERIKKWATAMFDREIEQYEACYEVVKVCRDNVSDPFECEAYAQKMEDCQSYLNWLRELREYANV